MVISKFKKAAVALAFLSTFGAANATDYDLGLLTGPVGKSNIQVDGSFDDTFYFTVNSLTEVSGYFVGFDFTALPGVPGDLQIRFLLGNGDKPGSASAGTLSPALTDDDGFFEYTHPMGALEAGKYFINFAGTGTASYSVTLAPVPEPETYALLLAGLGLVGAAVRRRRVAVSK